MRISSKVGWTMRTLNVRSRQDVWCWTRLWAVRTSNHGQCFSLYLSSLVNSQISVVRRESFLYQAQSSLSHFEYGLFSEILSEWECFSSTLRSFLRSGKCLQGFLIHSSIVESLRNCVVSTFVDFTLRHQEVLLLANSLSVDVSYSPRSRTLLIFLIVVKIFDKYNILYQKGEKPPRRRCDAFKSRNTLSANPVRYSERLCRGFNPRSEKTSEINRCVRARE